MAVKKSLNWGAKAFGSLGGAGLFTGLVIGGQVFASEFDIKPSKLPWYYKGIFRSFDHAALRRGYQVYAQVCAACHSMDMVYWFQLVDVSHTEKEIKAMAAEHLYEDGPDDNGDMFQRPGRPFDPLPSPYKNDKEARAANGGALPPDLMTISRGRHGGPDYIFHLLTAYYDAPEGAKVGEGQHFNAYFPGHSIGMAKALYPGVMEYEEGDDTTPTVSQMAKDVAEFLEWSSAQYNDDRMRLLTKFGIAIGLLAMGSYFLQRRYFARDFSKRVIYSELPKRK
eukprot:scpid87324/ scgid18238/ Cytochrome c1, heme protein, mitochondrial; Complex III subunit 4; Complex III subunit IV; Cytochrome b-c1 complex subunit 4; Ubiquinol-cytochrome-c reductase complex cytochrome c1 subunit